MFWKTYFWCFAVLVVGSLVGRVVLRTLKPHTVTRFDVFESWVGAASVIAVYGYAFDVTLGGQAVWVALALLLLGLYVLSLRGDKTRQLFGKLGRARALLVLGGSFLLTLPGYAALVLYAAQDARWAHG